MRQCMGVGGWLVGVSHTHTFQLKMYFIIIIEMIACACTVWVLMCVVMKSVRTMCLRRGFHLIPFYVYRFCRCWFIRSFVGLFFSFVCLLSSRTFQSNHFHCVEWKWCWSKRKYRNVKRLSKQTIINAFVNKTKQFNYFGCKTIVVVSLPFSSSFSSSSSC